MQTHANIIFCEMRHSLRAKPHASDNVFFLLHFCMEHTVYFFRWPRVFSFAAILKVPFNDLLIAENRIRILDSV